MYVCISNKIKKKDIIFIHQNWFFGMIDTALKCRMLMSCLRSIHKRKESIMIYFHSILKDLTEEEYKSQ